MLLLWVACARAQTAAPVAQPAAPLAEPPLHAALELDGKVPVVASLSGVQAGGAVPLALAGVRYGRIAALVGFGLQRSSSSTDLGGTGGTLSSSPTESSITVVTVAPTLTLDLWRPADRRSAIYLLGAALLGGYFQSISRTANGNTMSASSDNFAYGYQFAIGARTALSEHFSLGVEAGPIALYYKLDPDLLVVMSPSSTAVSTRSTLGLYASLVGTFRLGE